MQGLTIPFTGLRRQYNSLRQEILDATDEVLRSGILMNGNNTAEFEHWLKKKNNVSYAVTCHSGTVALEIIARYHYQQQLPKPPTVLIPSMTYVATANAFANAGWDIQFIDVDSYGILDYKQIPEFLIYQAVVIIGMYGASVTHFGNTKFWTQREKQGTIVIEDAAQHWLAADCQRIGNAAAISFDPMKNLACYGNGGAVLTNDRNLYEFAVSWRDNGKLSQHLYNGSNVRMSELDCAHMLVKTNHVSKWQSRRENIANFWMESLKDFPVRCLTDRSNAHDHAYHKFVIDIDQRDQIKKELANRKIETRVHYERPLHELDGVFRQYPGPGLLATSSSLSRRVLSLPIYPELTDLEVEYIIDRVRDCAS
jgi:dTDP-4-amino-4,6-dideoxygalactose transaminase